MIEQEQTHPLERPTEVDKVKRYGEPDFSQFTYDELVYVLARIDRHNYPERVERIEALIRQGGHPIKKSNQEGVTVFDAVDTIETVALFSGLFSVFK